MLQKIKELFTDITADFNLLSLSWWKKLVAHLCMQIWTCMSISATGLQGRLNQTCLEATFHVTQMNVLLWEILQETERKII